MERVKQKLLGRELRKMIKLIVCQGGSGTGMSSGLHMFLSGPGLCCGTLAHNGSSPTKLCTCTGEFGWFCYFSTDIGVHATLRG